MQLFDDTLRKVRSFGELLLNLFVDIQLLLEFSYSFLKVLVFEDYLFSLLALVFQFCCKLMVLKHGESGGGLEFFLFKAEQVLPHLSDFVAHFCIKTVVPSLILSVA